MKVKLVVDNWSPREMEEFIKPQFDWHWADKACPHKQEFRRGCARCLEEVREDFEIYCIATVPPEDRFRAKQALLQNGGR